MGTKVSVVESDRVEVAIDEYNKLVRASEKIATLERLISASNYVSIAEVKAVLDIKTSEPTESDINVFTDR